MKHALFIGAVLALASTAAEACSIHATHVAAADASGRTSASAFHAYTRYDRPPGGGHEYESHSAQFSLSRWFSERFAAQFGAPVLHKELNGESESGLGDATLIGLYRAFRHVEGSRHLRLDLFAGLKMPTGDTDQLRGERESAMAAQPGMAAMPSEMPHSMGHHLTLGSGSWDGLFGANAVMRQGEWMLRGTTQYSARTEGDHGYRFGDEWTWRAGLHRFALRGETRSLRVGLDVSGEWRDRNEVDGEPSTPTKRAAYAGPAMHLAWGSHLQAALTVDLPIYNEDEGLSGAADLRTQASLVWSF